ncbi:MULTISPECIES: cytochrome P450 [unclassified Streptomyces]|uniref:cytochrome P450 n=1 Tax=unclassified Streptomyces TaxID=2593676 RepID=UPI0036511D4A
MTDVFTAGLAPGRLPLVGHGLQLQRRPLEYLASLPRYGDVVTLQFGPVPVHLVCHPELARQVLTDTRTFDKGGLAFDKARVFVGNGLVACARADHRRQRRMIQPAFHPDRVNAYAAAVTEQTRRTMAEWQPGQVTDIGLHMHHLTARITAATLFSTDIPLPVLDEIAGHLNTVLDGLYRQVLMPVRALERIPTRANRAFRHALTRLKQVIDEIVTDYRNTSEDRGDLLSALLAATDEDTGAGLTDEEIRDQVMTVMIAGTETTASALAWTFHYLGTHPAVEGRLHTEVDTVLGGRAPTVADLPKLEVTRRVFTEALRLRPPGWMTTRVTTTPTQLAGLTIPRGATVIVSPYVLHHDPRSFPQPEHFDPDRWLPHHAQHMPRGAMIPFGAGTRKCIGDTLAMTEATLALAHITTHWQLTPKAGHTVKPAPRMTLGVGPLPMHPTPRPAPKP